MDQHNVIFQPSGRRGPVDSGTTIQAAARMIGVEIESICGGRGSCGKCKVRILEGNENGLLSSLHHLSPPNESEVRYAKQHGFAPNERLACQALITGDVAVFVPEESRMSRQIILKAASERTINVIPAIRKYYIELEPADLSSPAGDGERVQLELERIFGLGNIKIDHQVLRTLPHTLRKSNWKVTLTVWDQSEIIRVEPGFSEKCYGLAIDIGTTTIGAYLCDLATGEVLASEATVNPQIEFGEDVIARIAYAKEHDDGLTRLSTILKESLNQLIVSVTGQIRIKPDDIAEVVVVGNTAMHHIFLELDIVQLGLWPFVPAIQHSLDLKARNVGLSILPSANVHVLPIEAGFVGADNVGVILAEEPHQQDDILLIIDIGTNGELVLGNRERLLSASCATGPAFEGATIRFGMRAATGAIDKVRIDPHTHDVRFTVIGKTGWNTELPEGEIQARGICGSGIVDAIAEMLNSGIITKSGSFDKTLANNRLRFDHQGKPEFVIAYAHETAIAQDIVVTQHDVRSIQLAKAAIFAGTEMLLARLGRDRPDKVILAGAFGTVIDRKRALRLGMFPDIGLDNICAVGNAAGDGARIALLNKEKRLEADRIARQVEYVELTAEPGFEEAFIKATQFPA